MNVRFNEQSWALDYDKKHTLVKHPNSCLRVSPLRVYLDHGAGILSYSISQTMTVHKAKLNFTDTKQTIKYIKQLITVYFHPRKILHSYFQTE